jgi:hypothetical protein
MIIKCPKCLEVTPAADVNIHKAVAVCRDCDHAFTVGKSNSVEIPRTALGFLSTMHQMSQASRVYHDQLNGGEVDNGDKVLGEHDVVVNRDYDGIELKYPWRKGGIKWFFLIFAIFWNAISLPAFFFAILPKILSGEEPMAILFIIHPMVGITIGYYVLASFLNKTSLKIGREKLNVKVGPLPWFGSKEFDTKDVRQLYVERYVPYTRNRMPVINYQVKIMLDGHVNSVLLKGIDQYHNALAFEVLTQKYLNIEDQEVEGDVLKSEAS